MKQTEGFVVTSESTKLRGGLEAQQLERTVAIDVSQLTHHPFRGVL
jgi:hypothetical protein